MQEVLVVVVFLVCAFVIGSLLKPNDDQLRPLTPQASSGDSGHDHHH